MTETLPSYGDPHLRVPVAALSAVDLSEDEAVACSLRDKLETQA